MLCSYFVSISGGRCLNSVGENSGLDSAGGSVCLGGVVGVGGGGDGGIESGSCGVAWRVIVGMVVVVAILLLFVLIACGGNCGCCDRGCGWGN